MATIKVNYNQFNKTITAIDTYVTNHRSNMKSIDQKITNLNSSWQGSDYDALKQKWEEMNNTDSTSEQMVMALEAYADKLRYAIKKYKAVQSSLINSAYKLPRY